MDFYIYFELPLRNNFFTTTLGGNMQFFKLLIILLLFISSPKAQYDAVSIGLQSADQNLLHSATFYKGNLFSGLDAVRMGIDIEETSSQSYMSNTISENNSGGLSINLLMLFVMFRV